MMSSRQTLDRILQDLTGEDGVLGAALISRDGLCVRAMGKVELNRETFSAMSATLMGAAEIALNELEGGRARHIIAATERVKMVLMGATRDLLLVTCLRGDVPAERILPRIESAAASVAGASGDG